MADLLLIDFYYKCINLQHQHEQVDSFTSSIDNVKHTCIFVYLQRNKTNAHTAYPYKFDTHNINADHAGGSYLTTCRLEYANDIFTLKLNMIVRVK